MRVCRKQHRPNRRASSLARFASQADALYKLDRMPYPAVPSCNLLNSGNLRNAGKLLQGSLLPVLLPGIFT